MILPFDTLKSCKLAELSGLVTSTPKKRLDSLCLFDFILYQESELPFVHGIYAFFDTTGEKCLYVGRVLGPQFIERVPAHFAIGNGSRYNQFLRAHKESNDFLNLADAAISARSCQFLLMPMPHALIRRAEELLILLLAPNYNKRIPRNTLGSHDLPSTDFETALLS